MSLPARHSICRAFVRRERAARTLASELWPDGRPYVTGYSKSDGYRSYPGLHWIVLVREDRQLAYAPVRSLQTNILISGAVFALIAAILAWELADRLALPLLQLADAAEGLRSGRRRDFPQVGGYDEARILSQSLRSMMAELDAQRASLAAANQSATESQVRERTQRLAEQNIGLERAKAECGTRDRGQVAVSCGGKSRSAPAVACVDVVRPGAVTAGERWGGDSSLRKWRKVCAV